MEQPINIEQEGTSGDGGSSPINEPSVVEKAQSEEEQREIPIASDPDDLLMCRVCRGNEGNLYYPCLCTGSIKYVHQECLVEWLKYSKKEYCELCNHKYSFQPIYRQDMPKILPIIDLAKGVVVSISGMIKTWIIYTCVMMAWLGVVPLTTARIYNCIFYMSLQDILSSPMQLIRTENIVQDIFKGSILLFIFICTFISLVWLKEQIITGGPQNFLNIEDDEEDDENDGGENSEDEEGELFEQSDSDLSEVDDEEDDGNETEGDEDDEIENEEAAAAINENRGGFLQRLGAGILDQFDNFDGDENVEPNRRRRRNRRRQYDNMHDEQNEGIETAPEAGNVEEDEAEETAGRAEGGEYVAPEEAHRQPTPPQNEAQEIPEGGAGENEPNDEVPNEPQIQLPRRRRRNNNNNNNQRNDDQQRQEQDDHWRDDWDRFGEDLTWQRLLGLDGSFIFLEHVFWVISLNTLFTVTVAYIPYRFGQYILTLFGIQNKITYFPSIVSMLSGYVMIAIMTFIFHKCVGFMKLKTLYRFLGILFLIIKVFLLVLMEIGLFPVMCGCWMDICTLALFSTTLSQRIATFSASPFMSIFLHWMIGMVYVFYSASFVILLREILRPGVLWFMRNLNDPDFNPIQEMIDLPFTRHLRRLIVSTTLFFTTILLIFYIPLNIINKIAPTILPYNVSMSADTPLSELSLELLILQIILPAILEHAHVRIFIKGMVRLWCFYVGKMLDLDRYLISDSNNSNNNDDHENNAPAAAPLGANGVGVGVGGGGGGLAAEHQALLLLREPQVYEPYVRPSFFAIRIGLLLTLMAATTTLTSVLIFVTPVQLGRAAVYMTTNKSNVHEVYTIGIGSYICWMIGKAAFFVYTFAFGRREHVFQTMWTYSYLAFRLLMVSIPIVLIFPYLIGSLFELMFLTPIRLSHNQTALEFPYQDWAMGVLQMKIFAVVAMMGPDWWLKTELETVVRRGLGEFEAVEILARIVLPSFLYLSTFLAFPVVVIKAFSFCTGFTSEATSMLMLRYSYPLIFFVTCCVLFLRWQIAKFRELTEKIKNERYLVRTQLVNYEKNGVRV